MIILSITQVHLEFLNFNLQRERENKKTFFVFMLFKHSITLSVCLSYLHFYVYFPSYQNIGGNFGSLPQEREANNDEEDQDYYNSNLHEDIFKSFRFF